MGLHDDFVDKALASPEWEKIRDELCTEYENPDVLDLGGGLSMWSDGDVKMQGQDDELFMKLCWYVNSGPGYCKDAPPKIQALLTRLGLRQDVDNW